MAAQVDVMRLLHRMGAKLDLMDYGSRTAICLAAEAGHVSGEADACNEGWGSVQARRRGSAGWQVDLVMRDSSRRSSCWSSGGQSFRWDPR